MHIYMKVSVIEQRTDRCFMHDNPGQLRVIKVFIGLSNMVGSQENI